MDLSDIEYIFHRSDSLLYHLKTLQPERRLRGSLHGPSDRIWNIIAKLKKSRKKDDSYDALDKTIEAKDRESHLPIGSNFYWNYLIFWENKIR